MAERREKWVARRSGEDRRKSYRLGFFLRGGVERRSGAERRSAPERRGLLKTACEDS